MYTLVNVGLGCVAAIIWVQIFRLEIIPSLSGSMPHLKTETTAPARNQRPATPAKDPNDVIRSLMNSDDELKQCLEKVNPGDPLGMSGDSAQHTAARNACLEKYQK